MRGEVVGVGVFDEAEDVTRPMELCLGDPYGLAFGVEAVDDEVAGFLLLIPGLVGFTELGRLVTELLDGEEVEEETLDGNLCCGSFLGLCCAGVLLILLGGGISRGSLDDFDER